MSFPQFFLLFDESLEGALMASHITSASQNQLYKQYTPHINPLQLKLDRNNFQFWMTQVHSTARAHLDGFLLGKIPRPSQDLESTGSNGESVRVPNPEFILWTRLDQFLLSRLFSSISEAMLGHVNRCASAEDVWITLQASFHMNS